MTNSVSMAVLDKPNANGNGATPANGTIHGTAQRLRSMPLDASFSTNQDGSYLTGSDPSSEYSHMHNHTLSAHNSFRHGPSASFSSHASGQREHALQPPGCGSSSGGGVSMANCNPRDRNGSNNMALVPVPSYGGQLLPVVPSAFSLACSGNGFMADLIGATESPMPLDRYKAFVRLFSTLRRRREALRLSPSCAAADDLDCAWESSEAQELVRQMVMVGECLAKFGTADFVDGRSNSARAITTKDYARVLRMYLEDNGAVFRTEFIARLPEALQDEVWTVRTLLHTRCETNDLLFNQLVKHVGQEPAAGGAMVINNSSVSANPTNHMLAAPRTFVNTVSSAWCKADTKRRTQIGAMSAVAVVAVWVLKRKFFGGGAGGGGRGHRRGRDDSEWGSSNGRRSSHLGDSDLATRLLDERSSVERTAVRILSDCQDELQRLQRNDQVLRNDWKLGPLRLALPGASAVPEGYEPVQPSYCSVAHYVKSLDSSAPIVQPYAHTKYSPPSRESSAAFSPVQV